MIEPTVGEIRSPGLVTCNPDDPLSFVARLLSDAEISALVVVNPGSNVPLGIISQFDLLDCFGKDLDSLKAREVMTYPVAGVLDADTVKAAISKMRQDRIHRLVVLNGKAEAIGVISVTDVIHTMRLRSAG